MSVDVAGQNVHMVIRQFKATCPTCGSFFCDHVGRYGTITKKQLAQLPVVSCFENLRFTIRLEGSLV